MTSRKNRNLVWYFTHNCLTDNGYLKIDIKNSGFKVGDYIYLTDRPLLAILWDKQKRRKKK